VVGLGFLYASGGAPALCELEDPRMNILDELAACKGQFGREAARRTIDLLSRLPTVPIRDAGDLIRLHENVLFLRAYPQNRRVVRLADSILNSFAERIRGIDSDAFEDPEISGIAGTSVSTNFSREFAQSLVRRHTRAVEIDWDDFAHPDRLGVVLGRLIPLAYETYAVEPHVDWRVWLETNGCNLRWLLERIDASTWELLEIPVRWKIDPQASRSSLRLPRRELFFHSGPLLKRADVSIESEFAGASIELQRLGRASAEAAIGVIVDASAARYRELHGFEHPDEQHVYHADLGRGVDFIFFGAAAAKRLPLRAYHCGMFFKNGVPIGYVETLSLFERCEVGFNLYYTFREGETAWLYVRILKVLREQLGVTCFSIDPYQLGHENEEAIQSGAFWFYYKLGFQPAASEIAELADREAAKIAAHPGHRTSPTLLRRLAERPLFYGATAADWASFSIERAGASRAGEELLKSAARFKRAGEETGYLRWLQRQPRLRRRVADAGSG